MGGGSARDWPLSRADPSFPEELDRVSQLVFSSSLLSSLGLIFFLHCALRTAARTRRVGTGPPAAPAAAPAAPAAHLPASEEIISVCACSFH